MSEVAHTWGRMMSAQMEAARSVNPFLFDEKTNEKRRIAVDRALARQAEVEKQLKLARREHRKAPRGHFTFSHSPDSLHPECWHCHHPDGSIAAEFDTCKEAIEAMRTWNSTPGCDAVTVDWIAPVGDPDDGDRGTYVVRIKNTRYREDVRAGWHSMEASMRLQKKLINAIVKHGLETVKDILCAAQDRYSASVWRTPFPEPPGYTFDI